MMTWRRNEVEVDAVENDHDTMMHVKRSVHTFIGLKYGMPGISMANKGVLPLISTLDIWCHFFETPIGSIAALQSQLTQTLLRPLSKRSSSGQRHCYVHNRDKTVACIPWLSAWDPVRGDRIATIATVCTYSRARLFYEALVVMRLQFATVDILVRSGFDMVTLLAITPIQLKRLGLFKLGPRIKIGEWQTNVKRRLTQLHPLIPSRVQRKIPRSQMPMHHTKTTRWTSVTSMVEEMSIRNTEGVQIVFQYIEWLWKTK
jgi:hypothetical protein